jgi:type IV pilus assembly protein PilW
MIELLLALALGVVVTAGIVQLFVGNNATYTLLTGQARMQEGGRFALDFIERSTRNAGYTGCGRDPTTLVRGLRGAWDNIYEFNMSVPVDAYEGPTDPTINELPRTVGGVSTNVYVPGNGIDTTAILADTDVLVTRRTRAPGFKLEQTLQPTGDQPVITAPGGQLNFDPWDVVVISDCEQSALVRVSSIAFAGNQATLGIDQGPRDDGVAEPTTFYENSATVVGPTGVVPFTLSFLGRSYGEDATVAPLETSIFFVAPTGRVNNVGDPINALWMKLGDAAPVELVEGIDDLEVTFGIDTTLADNQPNANRYVDITGVPDPSQIVAVRASVVASSVNAPSDSGVLQRTFSKTILLRNARPGV